MKRQHHHGNKLGNASDNTAQPPRDKRKGLVERLKDINRVFALTVLLPTTAAVLYFGGIASDVYISESRFVVRGAQRQPQMSVVGALLQGTGFARAQDDSYPVVDYVQSRDALRELNRDNYIANAYSKQGDFIGRFHSTFDGSFEALWKYYDTRIVSIDFDPTSSIATLQVRAYTAQDAAKINEQLLDISERLVNRLNERASTDTVQFAQRQVELAIDKAKTAAAALAEYRNSHTVFDPDRQSALQLQQVSSLQTQLFGAQTQLTQLQAISPQNPQIPVLKASIETLQKQIKLATGDVAGGQNSLSQKAAGYARLQLDAQLADKQLASAMLALDNARSEAERQQLYLERLVQPNTPDKAEEPRRFKRIFEVFALGMLAWGILSLLLAGIREHSD